MSISHSWVSPARNIKEMKVNVSHHIQKEKWTRRKTVSSYQIITGSENIVETPGMGVQISGGFMKYFNFISGIDIYYDRVKSIGFKDSIDSGGNKFSNLQRGDYVSSS